jgi:hypothetical protein
VVNIVELLLQHLLIINPLWMHSLLPELVRAVVLVLALIKAELVQDRIFLGMQAEASLVDQKPQGSEQDLDDLRITEQGQPVDSRGSDEVWNRVLGRKR